MFAAAGWQVLTVKYGRKLDELFDLPGGKALRARIDAMTNPEYQRLLRCRADELRAPPVRRRRRYFAHGRRGRRQHAHRRAAQSRWSRPREARCGFRRDRRLPPDGDLRLHDQGLLTAHRGPPAEPLSSAKRRADARAGRTPRCRSGRALGVVRADERHGRADARDAGRTPSPGRNSADSSFPLSPPTSGIRHRASSPLRRPSDGRCSTSLARRRRRPAM